jgi:hypothetical protein
MSPNAGSSGDSRASGTRCMPRLTRVSAGRALVAAAVEYTVVAVTLRCDEGEGDKLKMGELQENQWAAAKGRKSSVQPRRGVG